MTSSPHVTDSGRTGPAVWKGLLAGAVGVLLVTGAVTQTLWLARDLGVWSLVARTGLVVAAAIGGALVAAAVPALFLGPAGHPGPDPGEPEAQTDPARRTAPPPDDGLVRRVLEVRDLLDNPALQARLDEGIRSVGFEIIAPRPGAPFDPAEQIAVDTEPIRGGVVPGTIAAVEQIGLRRHGDLYRRASVVVWGTP